MSTESDTVSAFGISSSWGWSIGGIVGGVIGAAAFGLIMWLVDPEILSGAIPAIYGLEAVGVVGWGIHLAHGAVLGLVFGYVVSRDPVLGVLKTTPETEVLSRTGVTLRVIAAGFVFGLAIWAILPLIVLPVWLETIGTQAAGDFPGIAIESLIGHVLFGTVLGIVFAIGVDLRDRTSGTPLEE
ncbi:hypothetical protein EA462_07765 [Natrarchaeobius halalkaliphilus]|uniref:Histidine kinase n=1 Tax=Natrarchaeobius halalkaliphilus TaxID=1679091 RepID=A0A3N6NYI3_9EURY|nr:hypothetical protein [Natrarchaeobius halalkaliphilus]RQG89899.1 hypothetical protein EA462_07765 [Natrarchaeobius halalkaliphilus]